MWVQKRFMMQERDLSPLMPPPNEPLWAIPEGLWNRDNFFLEAAFFAGMAPYEVENSVCSRWITARRGRHACVFRLADSNFTCSYLPLF